MMELFSEHLFSNFVELSNGPARFRYLVQPIVAMVLGIRDGRIDARNSMAPYFMSLLFDRRRRWQNFRQGYRAIAKPFAVAIVLDAAVQLMVFRIIYVGEALCAGIFLIALPYLLVRGLTNRFLWQGSPRHTS